MAIFVTGDTHGSGLGTKSIDGYLKRLSRVAFPEQKKLTKEDYVIICGDFGGVWDTNRTAFAEGEDERLALDTLNRKPFTTLFVPGNHENYDRLTGIKDDDILNCWLYANMPDEEKEKLKSGYPRREWHHGFVREIRPSVLMLEPGAFDIDGHVCAAYGGAPSWDIQDGILNPADFENESEFKAVYREWRAAYKTFRVKGVSWWSQEQPGADEEKQFIRGLDACDFDVDFIFTHDCSTTNRALLGYWKEQTRINSFLESTMGSVNYKHWFFGHLHENVNLPGGKDHLIYEQILQIA